MWWILTILPIAAEGFYIYVQRRNINETKGHLKKVHTIAYEALQRDKDWKENDPGCGDIHARYNAVKQALMDIRGITREERVNE